MTWVLLKVSSRTSSAPSPGRSVSKRTLRSTPIRTEPPCARAWARALMASVGGRSAMVSIIPRASSTGRYVVHDRPEQRRLARIEPVHGRPGGARPGRHLVEGQPPEAPLRDQLGGGGQDPPGRRRRHLGPHRLQNRRPAPEQGVQRRPRDPGCGGDLVHRGRRPLGEGGRHLGQHAFPGDPFRRGHRSSVNERCVVRGAIPNWAGSPAGNRSAEGSLQCLGQLAGYPQDGLDESEQGQGGATMTAGGRTSEGRRR